MPLSLEDIKKLSPQMKALIMVGVLLLLGYFYYFFFLKSSLDEMNTLETKLEELQRQVAEKERIVAQLPRYKKEVEQLQTAFAYALTKLPLEKEIPGLLNSVALAGKSVSLNFMLFEPQVVKAENPADTPPDPKAKGKVAAKKTAPAPEKFYQEIPVKIIVQGSFHNIARFFEKVGELPRIINLQDITIEQQDTKKGKGKVLSATCLLKTYMFLEQKDEPQKKADEKSK
jgi:type IV pilus assembly protein PilO